MKETASANRDAIINSGGAPQFVKHMNLEGSDDKVVGCCCCRGFVVVVLYLFCVCVFVWLGFVLFYSVGVNRYADNQSNRITEFTLCFNNTVFFLLLPLKYIKE